MFMYSTYFDSVIMLLKINGKSFSFSKTDISFSTGYPIWSETRVRLT